MKEKELSGTLDEKLLQTEYMKQQSWGKIVSYLKRQFDSWTTAQLAANGYKNFKTAHMPVLMNITIDGINNNELAKRARVSKQAMSKVLKELTVLGVVKTKTDPSDKRSSIVLLTDKGKKLVIDARLCVKSLMDDYRKEFGKEKFDQHMIFMTKLIEYNDERWNLHLTLNQTTC
jgi:DNA-binding MarR family transcriptional regulator